MKIDINALREDLKQECYGAFFGGGFGSALMEAADLDNASPEELVEIARSRGLDPDKYICD